MPPSVPERLGSDRLRIYPLLFAGPLLLLFGFYLLTVTDRLALNGELVGGDFAAFWSAGSLILQGRAAEIYDSSVLAQQIATLGEVENTNLPIHYPPPALFLFAIPALFPFELGYAVWCAFGLGMMILVLRLHHAGSLGWRWGISFPGVLVAMIMGQTSLFVLGALGAALALLRTQPILAGVATGLLICKPNYLLPVLLAFLAGRQLRVVFIALFTALGLCVASLIFGTQTWIAWWHNASFATELLYRGQLPLQKMPTLTGAYLSLGLPGGPVFSGVIAVVVLCSLGALWFFDTNEQRLRASIPLAAILATPFAFDYDLAILWLSVHAGARYFSSRPTGAFRWMTLGVLWVSPAVIYWANQIYLPIGPVFISSMYLFLIGDAVRSRETLRDHSETQIHTLN